MPRLFTTRVQRTRRIRGAVSVETSADERHPRAPRLGALGSPPWPRLSTVILHQEVLGVRRDTWSGEIFCECTEELCGFTISAQQEYRLTSGLPPRRPGRCAGTPRPECRRPRGGSPGHVACAVGLRPGYGPVARPRTRRPGARSVATTMGVPGQQRCDMTSNETPRPEICLRHFPVSSSVVTGPRLRAGSVICRGGT